MEGGKKEESDESHAYEEVARSILDYLYEMIYIKLCIDYHACRQHTYRSMY